MTMIKWANIGAWDERSQAFWFKTSQRNILIVNGKVLRYRAAGLQIEYEVAEVIVQLSNGNESEARRYVTGRKASLIVYPYTDTPAPTKQVYVLCVDGRSGQYKLNMKSRSSGRIVITFYNAHLVDHSMTNELGGTLRDQRVVFFGRKQNTHRVIGYALPFTGVN